MSMTLADLEIGASATIVGVGGDGSLRQHLLDMGMLPGVEVTMIKFAPMGDPLEVRIHDYELTLRKADAAGIVVETSRNGLSNAEHRRSEEFAISPEVAKLGGLEHPGLGEEGRYHSEQERDSGVHHSAVAGPLTFALVGNQNCGKTTLFNQLTGSNQHVGNFPGVTVDRKDGFIRGHHDAVVTDLPGIYSLSPYTSEEIVSRRFILEEKPSAIINIVDATCIERNLYLTMQLMELGIPMVLALNMMDEVERNGGAVRINRMEAMLGIPVIPISAMKNEGVDEVIRHALHVARYQEAPLRQDFCSPNRNGGVVHRAMHAIMHLIENRAKRAEIPLRFAASKLIEGDALVAESLGLSDKEQEAVEHIVRQMEEERGLDRQAAMAAMRFAYIGEVCEQTVVRPHESAEYRRSKRIDRVLTGRWTALPAFVAIMGVVFWITFSSLGAWLQELCEAGIEWVTEATDSWLTEWGIAPSVHSLIIDGIYSGVGTVLTFLPLILLLFFFLSMLEDSGYMARIAFVMDRLLRRIGLSGRSIVPLLIGFGCSVPSVMSSRTLPSHRDRRLTVLLTPFMSCTAKVPVYAFFSAAFFPDNAALVTMSLYILGIVVGIVVALVLKRTHFSGEAVPFVMELPNYRMPLVSNVSRLLWEKAKDFVQRAFSVIFVASMVIWFLQTFDFGLDMVAEGQEKTSMLAQIADVMVPVFEPWGCGDWRIITALASGFLAKESVVSTLSTLFAGVPMSEVLTPVTAYALMVFCLLYTPCVAAMATIRRELGTKYAVMITAFQCVLAWVVAYGVYLLSNQFFT